MIKTLAPMAALIAAISFSGGAIASPAKNAVVNPGFEQNLDGWTWNVSKADATCAIDTTTSHSGAACVRLTNKSAFGPNIYGSLQQTVTGLTPDTDYELSVWIKSADAQSCWFGGGPGWTMRKGIPR